MIRAVFIAFAATVLAACGSSGAGRSSSAAAPAGAGPTGTGTPGDQATLAAISTAYATFFGSKSTVAQSQAALQHGAKFHAALVKQGESSYAQKSSATVNTARLTSPDVAAVTFTVSSGGSVLLAKAPGYAVMTGGKWQVAAQTFCGLVRLEGDAPKACDDPAVTALPH